MPDSVPPLVTLVCRERVSLQLSAYTELGLRYFFRSISFLVQKKFLIQFAPHPQYYDYVVCRRLILVNQAIIIGNCKNFVHQIPFPDDLQEQIEFVFSPVNVTGRRNKKNLLPQMFCF